MNQHEGLAGGTRSRADVSFKTRPKKVGGFAVIILVNSGLQRRKSTRGVMHFPDQEKCSVCLDPPGPHIYYGARVRRGERGGEGGGESPDKYSHHSTDQACLPCRAFFKRSVEQNQVYICYGDSNCVVTYNGRKTCKYCRFQVRPDQVPAPVPANLTAPS